MFTFSESGNNTNMNEKSRKLSILKRVTRLKTVSYILTSIFFLIIVAIIIIVILSNFDREKLLLILVFSSLFVAVLNSIVALIIDKLYKKNSKQ